VATSLKVSGFSSGALAYKIVYLNNDTPVATIQENVTGTSGHLYSVNIHNSAGSAVHVKLSDGAAPELGTTAPQWIFKCHAQERLKIDIPSGVPFSTALNLWTTLLPDSDDTTVPAGTVTVTLVCS
jgi:hypothetical protein|tara:strand:- start:4135 stop:4512 length:378 start_codon:yes stop_codon:yes gene_type:complete